MVSSAAKLVTALSLAVGTTAQYLSSEDCPILGPSFPKAFDICNSTAIQTLQSTFPELIKSAVASGTLNGTHTSFTIDVFSATNNQSIYSYHHAAPALNGSLTKGVLDDETVYRIGSVSKLFTVYAILVRAGGLDIFDHSVTKYLPELEGEVEGGEVEKIRWEDVSVGALASQMGGSGGFPLETAICYNGSQSDCSIPDFLKTMRDQKIPVAPPFQTPLYSDAGFGILGRVLERMTGLPYAEALEHVLATPLGLKHTASLEPTGDSVNGLIVPGNTALSSWGVDNQVVAPSGGIYSNAADLRTLGLSILHSQFLSPIDTRAWMKPHSHTASLSNSVGAPWEINRLPLPVSPRSNRTRISDLYTKLGGQAGYATVFAVSPDHDVGFSILLAGETAIADRLALRAIVAEAWITAAEHAAWENAERNFPGSFVGDEEKTNLTLTVDEDAPGIGLESFYMDGVDVRGYILSFTAEFPAANLSVRLYPTGLVEEDLVEEGRRRRELHSFRAIPRLIPSGPRGVVQGGKGMFDDGCAGWESVDFNILEVNGVDGFVFEVVDGRLEGVMHPATGVALKRVDRK